MIVFHLQMQKPDTSDKVGSRLGRASWLGPGEGGTLERRPDSWTSQGTWMRPSGAPGGPLKPFFLLPDVLGLKGQNPALLMMQTAM